MRQIILRLVIISVALTLWACSAQDLKNAGRAVTYCAQNPDHC